MTAKPYEMWSAAAVDSRLSPVEVTVEMSMETTGRLLNVASTCRRRPACQLAGVLRGPLRCSDYSSGDRFWPGPNTRAVVPGPKPAQGGPTTGVPTALRGGRPHLGRLDRLSPPLPDPPLRQAPADHRRPPRHHPGLDRAPPVQRPDRVGQHKDPAHHSDGVRVRKPRRPHRPGHAQPRRPQARDSRPDLTHGSVRRA